MKKLLLLTLLLSTSILSACKEKIDAPNGKIPSEFLPIANKYAGTFVGEMGGSPTRLTISIVDRSVRISATEDLIGSGCNSAIGSLLNFTGKKKNGNYLLTTANFEFDARNCRGEVKGQILSVNFKNENAIALSLVKDVIYGDGGGISGDDFRSPGTFDDSPSSSGNGAPSVRTVYLTGKFKRK